METTGNDQGGGGGGICTIKTSDLIGMVGNLMERVQNIEQVLSLLTGANITTSTLAEISQSLGTVTNATLINMLGGWTTDGTFSGVAISTLGWTMSDGCAFPIVVMQDGVLQYGLDECGEVSGEQTGGLVTDYMNCRLASTAKVGNNWALTEVSRGGTAIRLVKNVAGGSNIVSTLPGLYHVDILLPALSTTGAGTSTFTVDVDTDSSTTIQFEDSFHRDAQENITHKLSFNFRANKQFEAFNAGDVYFNMDVNTLTTQNYRNISKSHVGVYRLADA